jgi:hypothetical protein
VFRSWVTLDARIHLLLLSALVSPLGMAVESYICRARSELKWQTVTRLFIVIRMNNAYFLSE